MKRKTDAETGITVTRRNLPHWTRQNALYWVTFRLVDSLPGAKLNAWKAERELWVRKHPEPRTESEWREYDRRFGRKLESWLDAGYGECVLARPGIRGILRDCLLRFEGVRLLLPAAVIMPNHVHLLMEVIGENSLSGMLGGIKGASARRINRVLGREGRLWQDESYDHIVRSRSQYLHFLRYIADNPARAGLGPAQYWLRLPGRVAQTFLSVSGR